jgi:hypothetical protein
MYTPMLLDLPTRTGRTPDKICVRCDTEPGVDNPAATRLLDHNQVDKGDVLQSALAVIA